MVDFVAILNTGVTGFAFLMLFVGYKLISKAQTDVLERDPNDFPSIEFFGEWRELVHGQLINARYFMGFTALLFFGGLFLLIYRGESHILLTIAPMNESIPTIIHQAKVIEIDENGNATITVKSDEIIQVLLNDIVKSMNALQNRLSKQEYQMKIIETNSKQIRKYNFTQ